MLKSDYEITPLIAPANAVRLAESESVLFLDTRAEVDYLGGHIPGAINCNRLFTYLVTDNSGGMELMAETLAAEFSRKGIQNSHYIIIYENAMDSGYGQSCRGHFIMKYLGHEKVSILNGGFTAWALAGLPIDHNRITLPESSYIPAIDASHIATKEDVKAAIGQNSVILLDCRDREEWLGLSSSPYGRDFCPRKGRIPGAVWLEWYRLMTAESGIPVFKDKTAILDECQKNGITIDSNIIIYCFKGSRASNTFIALKQAGIKNVKNYFASWNEWSRDFSLPIDDRILDQD